MAKSELEDWFDNKSWEPKELPETEPEIPSGLEYYRMGCDELYAELGGEG